MTPQEQQNLLALLNSTGWLDILMPMMEHQLKTDILALSDQSRTRTLVSDDYLRGRISALRWILTHPANLVKEEELRRAKKPAADAVGHPYFQDNPGTED